jgi:O-antigen/teichoic acid export membrane protein
MKSPLNEGEASPLSVSPEAPQEVLGLEFSRNLGQISRHSAVFFLGTLFTMGAGYLVKIYVARVLGAEQLGLYALGMTLVSLVQMAGMLGLHGTAPRFVAVYNSARKFDQLRGFLTRSTFTILFLNIVFSIGLVLGGHWIAKNLYHAPALAQYIPLFAVLAVLGAINVFYCQVLAGFKDIAKRTVITNFVGSPLVIALTVVLLALGTGMWGYLSAQIISSVVVVALLLVAVWRLTPPEARFSLAASPPLDGEVKSMALAFMGMGALDFLVSQADKILLGLYLNPRVVGVYVLASTLSSFIPIILQSVNQIFAPVIADLHAQGRQDVLQRLFQTLTKWVIGLTFPLACVMFVFAARLLRIFGPEFESGWPVLVIGAVGQLVNCGVGSVGYLLLMSGNQKRLMKVQFAMTIVSVVTNITLIPTLGLVGAALASAGVNVGSNLWNLYEVRKALGISPYNRSYFALWIPVTSALSTVLLIRYWADRGGHAYGNPWLAIGLALVLGYTVFGGFAAAFVFDPDDRMIARSAWSQLRAGMQRFGVKAS